jgi:hypothetical protein
MADAAALAQGAIERLLENERLRGDLTDEGFNPLIVWGTDALTEAAQGVTQAPDDAATARMAEAEETTKRLIGAVVRAAQEHSREAVRALMDDPAVAHHPRTRLRLIANGWRLGDDPDANAIRLTGTLREVPV